MRQELPLALVGMQERQIARQLVQPRRGGLRDRREQLLRLARVQEREHRHQRAGQRVLLLLLRERLPAPPTVPLQALARVLRLVQLPTSLTPVPAVPSELRGPEWLVQPARALALEPELAAELLAALRSCRPPYSTS